MTPHHGQHVIGSGVVGGRCRRQPLPTVTADQLDMLRHTVGLTQTRGRRAFRNHFCTYDNAPKLEALVGLGLMERGNTLNEGRDRYYHATALGLRVARANKAEGTP